MGRFAKNQELGRGASSVEIPQVSTVNRPAGQNGQIIFNTTTSTYQVYNGSQWYNVSEASREKTLVIDKFQGDGSTTVFGGGKGNTLAARGGQGNYARKSKKCKQPKEKHRTYR